MDDSDQDFVDLCSKLLKRVRKRPGEPRQPRKAEHQSSSQASDGDKRRRNHKRDGDPGAKRAGTQSVGAGAEQDGVRTGAQSRDSGDAGSSAGPRAERGLAAKDKVLHRMQQFKRASPLKMVHRDKSPTAKHEGTCVPPPPAVQSQDTAESFSSDLHPETQDSDEALALRLQQELDREAAQVQTVNSEDGGLFFCHICHRDLSRMTPGGRTQHLNRCLDESEESAPGPPPPPPGVPDCPICGKKLKSQKSRLAHLKRCSSDMDVPPAVLLQALQRQTEETQNDPSVNRLTETGGTKKRKGPSKPGLPARKKPRKKNEPLDEDTMVALALSSSLLEQERESERQTEAAASHVSMTPVLKWKPDAGKGRGKRRKGAIPRPPPLLLVQDAEAALARLQERVSALLLRSRAPSPPTPTRCPSCLPGWSGAAPLWQKSSLLDGGSTRPSDFYTPELRGFITPGEPVATDEASSNKPDSSAQPASEGTPVTGSRASILPSSSSSSSSQTAAPLSAPSTPGTGQLPVGSQTLRDLIELAEDGMTITQCGYTLGPDGEGSAGLITNLNQSGFTLEELKEQADLCVSGFLPETTHMHSDDTHRRVRAPDQPGAEMERCSRRSVAQSRLTSDLSSMVNNPQLSDVQLQVDSGDVYFAHSFMLYARCPLLAEMMHESGFGVQEEGMLAAQRVLMSDVPGEAVFALLQFLYTAHCSVPASLRPHVLELAFRFDLQDLQQLCELRQEDAATEGNEEQEENVNNQTDQAFLGLLRSMWNEEDEDNEGADTDGGSNEERGLEEDHQADDVTVGDREIREEKVNEEELEEIYEFAATQRKREEEEEEEDKVDEEEGEEEEVFTKLTEPKRCSKNLQPNPLLEPDPSLDRSYNRLFSDSWGVYEEGEPSSSSTSGQTKRHTSQSQEHQSLHKPSSKLSERTLLQSSASEFNDLSLSPPPFSSNLPVPGQSPGQDTDLDAPEESPPPKQGPHSICVPLSPNLLWKKKEPELIVLSDSSDEMEVVLSSRSPSPHSPQPVQSLQSYTQIKPQPVPKPNEPTQENQKSSGLEFIPDDPSAAPVEMCDVSPVDCSPEVSWLIPTTPLQAERSTATSSTQTRSSMCRTQLFPKDDASPPSSSVFSSPALNSRLQTANSPARDSAHLSPREGAVPRLKLVETTPCSSSFDLNSGPKRNNSCDVSEVFAVPLSQSKRSHPSKQDTHLHLQPYSSTPLHTELHQPSAPLATSPLHSDLSKQSLANQERDRVPSDSPEMTELGSFHLSPLSDPSGPPSYSSHRGLQSSQRHSDYSHQSQRSAEFNSGGELTGREMRDEEGQGESGNKGTGDGGEQEEAAGETGSTESSFQHSFAAMDEPPIAFNDSWGLDANPGCFSLRLEDSRGSSQRADSPGRQHAAGSSSSANCQPSPSSHSRGSDTASPPSKARSSQPSTNAQVSPSPSDPPTRTTPEISNSLLDSKIWDSWEEEEEEQALPLSQRVNPSAQLRTPASSHNKRRRTLVPITPMPHYSDMDTPELKNKLNRFGVRPLPKRQMILKLREIHQYTHQLLSSDSEEEAPSAGRAAQVEHPPGSSVAAGRRPLSCAQAVGFKEPRAPAATSPLKRNREEEAELLSASQGSNTSSTAASEESESRSNPELCLSSDGDSDSDGGISASQAVTRLQDRLQAVRSFILSDSELYTQILQYQPLVLSQLQGRLKAAGIRLGAAKLVDYLDSQCITFTTAKPGHSAPGRRRGKRPKAASGRGVSRKRGLQAI